MSSTKTISISILNIFFVFTFGIAGTSATSSNSEVQSSSSAISITVKDTPGQPRESRNSSLLAIFFTNAANGNIESCKCKFAPYGGMMRAATYLRQQKKEYRQNLMIDAGDSFPPFANGLLVTVVLNSLKRIGYDVAAVGEQEYSSKRFLNSYRKSGIPFLASNVINNTSGRVPASSTADFHFTRCGKKISIISIVDPSMFLYYPKEITKNLSVVPPKEFLTKFLKENKQDVLMVISRCGLEIDKQLAKEFPDIAIIIDGSKNNFLATPVRIGKTIIVHSGINMQYVGKLLISFDNENNIEIENYDVKPLTAEIPDDPYIHRLYEQYKEVMN